MIEEIAALAATLGKRPESDGLKVLCGLAAEELKGLLRPGLTAEDCGQAFVLAAAWLALAGVEASDDGVESFTAGEVTVRKRNGTLRQKALRMQALQVMKSYIDDPGFLFRGVRG